MAYASYHILFDGEEGTSFLSFAASKFDFPGLAIFYGGGH